MKSVPTDPDAKAGDDACHLLPLLYDELRRLAAVHIRNEPAGQTLQPTALVHEAYLRLSTNTAAQTKCWDSPGHFFAAAAKTMHRILVDHARHKKTTRKGGDWTRIELFEIGEKTVSPEFILSLDEALGRLEKVDKTASKIALLRMYGSSIEEIAETLDIGRATAFRNWAYARAFLKTELST